MRTHLILEMAADAFANRESYRTVEGAFTYREAHRRAKGGAAFLLRHDIEAVAYLGRNGLAFPLALFASGLAGKPLAPLNYRLADADLRKLLARTAPSLAIVDADMLPRVEGVEGVILVSREAFEGACATWENPTAETACSEQDIAVLLFTSGTTGEPKVAVLRHANLTSYVLSTVEFMSAGEDACALVSAPSYHIAGISAVLTGTYSGRRIAYLDSFAPDAWVQTAHTEK